MSSLLQIQTWVGNAAPFKINLGVFVIKWLLALNVRFQIDLTIEKISFQINLQESRHDFYLPNHEIYQTSDEQCDISTLQINNRGEEKLLNSTNSLRPQSPFSVNYFSLFLPFLSAFSSSNYSRVCNKVDSSTFHRNFLYHGVQKFL